ncbi:uncharacterized protein KY384_003428 [Bacidia gigantensis]|uniref:uncharacterized protein n=1 Tax=Bacidia gigantensis TaxID=2732470 RepID=UPI001D04660A|nr:uncharacterized protein KY384_003428 [Bacidia gigantensis]KAG8531792.1 hypothetical protein KY384_003428 [Bacidia gigantensis]
MAHKALALKEEGNLSVTLQFTNTTSADIVHPATSRMASSKKQKHATPKRTSRAILSTNHPTILSTTITTCQKHAHTPIHSIQRDPTQPRLFTNRAMTRLKLSLYEPVISDCLHTISLDSSSLKAYYYLSQAQLALHHPNEALSSALTAYDFCIASHDKSTQNVSNLVLACKKAKWEYRERARIRGRSALLRELEEGLVRGMEGNLEVLEQREGVGEVERAEEAEEVKRVWWAKVEEVRSVFAVADPGNLARREVPDYLIDNVTFSIMHDPVITKTGVSYDRSTLVEHLKRSEKDPLTAEPLRWADVRPNRALKAASDEFLENNGWAVDW